MTAPEPWLPVSLSQDNLDLTIEVPACPPVASIRVTRLSTHYVQNGVLDYNDVTDYVLTVLPQASTCTPSDAVIHRTVRLPGPYGICNGPHVMDGATRQAPESLAPDATMADILSLSSSCPKG